VNREPTSFARCGFFLFLDEISRPPDNSPMPKLLFKILILILPLATSAATDARLVTQAVVKVGESVLSSRQILLSGLLEKWLAAQNDPKLLTRAELESWFFAVNSEEFKENTNRLIVDSVVGLEAEGLGVAVVDPSQIEVRSAKLMIDFATLAQWKEQGFAKEEIQLMFRKKLRARSFLSFKVDTAGISVSDEEASEYFEKNRVKFGAFPFSQFKNSIKEALLNERLQVKLKDWFTALKQKYKVQNLNAASF
jgi:hypothetical protein